MATMRLSVDGFAGLFSRRTLIATGAAGAVALVALGAFSWKSSQPAAAAPESVVRPARVATINFRSHMHSLMLAGIVAPRIETTLGFRVAGKVIAREVDVGAIVQPGQLIARIDPTDYRLAVDNARAALASAEADYARAKADFERYQMLRGSASFMTQTLEAEVGQVLAQGQGMVKLARSDELEILVGVPEHRLKTVRDASKVTFELWSDTGRKYAAKLRELSPSADPMTRTYPARFTVVDQPSFIGIGMTASLILARPDPELLAEVPLSAIFQQGKEPAVWVVDKATSTVSLRPVTISRWRDETALIASGVQTGDVVAAAGVHKLEPGQKIRPVLPGAR
jgi:multidrug efflux pump subunit AcrA (membrane-fusion protein)